MILNESQVLLFMRYKVSGQYFQEAIKRKLVASFNMSNCQKKKKRPITQNKKSNQSLAKARNVVFHYVLLISIEITHLAQGMRTDR